MRIAAVLAILGLVIAAVVVKGFEQGDIKLNTQNLWLLHKSKITTGTAEASYYGQVNTGLSELTTVNSVAKDPGSILQSAYGAVILQSGNVSMATINLASPVDYAKESKDFVTLADSASVSILGATLAFQSDKSVSYATISQGKIDQIVPISKPDEIKDAPGYAAATASANGVIYVFSLAAGKVFAYDTVASRWIGSQGDVSGAAAGNYEMSSVGGKWVLLEKTSGKVWVQGVGSAKVLPESVEAKLQEPSDSGNEAFISTASNVYRVDFGGNIKSVATGSGTNARPVAFEGAVYSAWLNAGDGQLINCITGEKTELDGFDATHALVGSPEPVIQTNGSAAVLNDAESGWAWNLPDGKVIPSTQDWQSKIVPPPPVVEGGEVAKKQEPPVAEDDSFGARAGVLTTLPVLLNDHDPNPDDVLTIDPSSVTGFDDSKGSLRISADGQSFALLAKATATGSLSFSYRVTDGSQSNGMKSKEAANVTVSFKGERANSAPVWCDETPTPCSYRALPSASVLPGQSVAVPFLEGFVDPEGDKTFISAATLTSGTGSVAFSASGEVVFRSNLSKGATESAKVAVTVSDIRGASTTKNLTIKVSPNTPLDFTPFVVTTVTGQTKVVDIMRGVVGAVGQVTLSETPKSPANAQIETVGPTSFSVKSDEAQQLQIAVKFADENGVPKSSYVQVNVIEDSLAKIAVSPVSVLVRPGLDSTVDLYSAITNPSERSLLISLDRPNAEPGATLYAGKVKGGFVRVRGQTEDQSPGLIGQISYKVTDGTGDGAFSAEGQIFVYQMSGASAAPIGVDDSITLRAESTGDLDALANDVGTPGISLALDAKNVTCKGTGFDENGGLAFAAHGVLRIVAPTKKGTYHCTYRLYASDAPSLGSTANFSVIVTSKSSNKAPIAPTVKARVTSVAPVEIPIKLSGIDPDGDPVELVGVSASTQNKGYAAISARGNSVIYTVIPGEVGQDSFQYTVSDGSLTSTGWVKVGIFDDSNNDGPVTMVDIVDLVAKSGGKALFDPTANDYDTNGKGLTLVPGSLVPNLKAGTDAYDKAAALVSEPQGNSRLVTIKAPNEAGEFQYVYSVKDGFGNVALGSILVRVTKKAVPDQPEVTDTYVTASERGDLGTKGIDVITKKVTWLTGDAGSLKLSVVGNSHGFRVSGDTRLIGTPPATSTFVVFKLSGKNFAGEDVETYGILHIPRQSRVINLKDPAKVWEVQEGATARQDLLDWVSVEAGANLEINGTKVRNSASRPEASCTFVSGTTFSYSAGKGGDKFNDVCIVPVRYAGEQDYTELPIRIHIKANNPKPIFTNVTVEVMPGAQAQVDLKSMVSWDQANSTWNWDIRNRSGSSITKSGPENDILTFEVVKGSEARDENQFEVRVVGEEDSYGIITVIVGESPNSKPAGVLTFDNCDAKKGSCVLHVSDLTGVVNAFPQDLTFTPIGYTKGNPNYKTGKSIFCGFVEIRVTDANTVTAKWDIRNGAPTSQACSAIPAPGALLDAEGKKGTLKITVDLKGVPRAPLKVEQVDFSKSSVTLRITAGDYAEGDNRVTEYLIKEGKRSLSCARTGVEALTTCKPIEDLRPFHGTDEENLHTYSVTAKNYVGESAAYKISNVYAYEPLRELTSDVISAFTVSGRESAQDMGVAQVTISPIKDPLAAKYVITGEGGGTRTEIIGGNYKERTFQLSAKPGVATEITVRAEGAIKPPVSGTIGTSSASWTGRISGTPKLGGPATAQTVGERAPYAGQITVASVDRNYSAKPSHIAYIFYSGSKPGCSFDSKTNALTVTDAGTALIKYAVDTSYNDQVSKLRAEVPGLQANVNYKAMVCYSNGFGEGVAGAKIIEVPGTISSVSDPDAGDFEYTVAKAATPQAGYLVSWEVKLSKQPAAQAGLKAQFSGATGSQKVWKDSIYSDAWGEQPVIYVRYCSTDGSLCSAGLTVVNPSDPTKAWQARIKSVFFATLDPDTPTVRATCPVDRRNLQVNFGLVGDGLSGWDGGTPGDISSGEYLAQYQLENSTTWSDLDDNYSFYKVQPSVGNIAKFRFYVQLNRDIVGYRGLADQRVQLELAISCKAP